MELPQIVSSILRSILLCLSLRCAVAWDLTVSTGQCDPTDLDADKVVRYSGKAFDSCEKISIPGTDIDIGVQVRCGSSGSKVTIFEDKTCAESSKLRHVYIGKSGECMLLTGVGHYATLVWETTQCS